MTRAEAKAYRNKIDGVLTKVTTDAEALKYAELYPLWSGYADYAVGEDGTIDNPITAAAGMRYFKDKYYLDGGKTYKCIRDDSNGQGTILQYLPSQLVGIYFEEVI